VPLIALASVKGSPGVTTTGLALAGAWPGQERRLLLEADPAGGDLAAWLGLPPAPGLPGLAAAARHDHDSGVAWEHARDLGGGLHLVAGPPGAEQAGACLTALAGDGSPLLAALAATADVTIADCGRLDPASPALSIAAAADLVLVMVRPRVSDLSHLALRADGLSQAGARLALLLAPGPGRRPAEASYPAAEIAATLDIPVQGTMPADPGGAAALIAGRADMARVRRAPLARAAAALAAALAAAAGQPQSEPAAALPRPARHLAHDPAPAEVAAGDTP
jgi:MinD-like ATPase involved in chromosome partitioning or flagellar assembly